MSDEENKKIDIFGSLLSKLGEDRLLYDVKFTELDDTDIWCRDRKIAISISANLPINDLIIPIRMGLREDFPQSPPEIAVDVSSSYRDLPHVDENDGKLCYIDDDYVHLNRHDLHGILSESLQYAVKVLEAGLYGNTSEEYLREIVAYWIRFTNRHVDAVIDPGDEPCRIIALSENNAIIALVNNESDYIATQRGRALGQLSHRSALYVPINPLTVDENFKPSELTTIEGLRKYVLPVLSGNKRLLKWAKNKPRRDEYLLLGINQQQNSRALIALHLSQIEDGNPIFIRTATCKVEPIIVTRLDKTYLMPRGGAAANLEKKRVFIVGCGSVGGHIAHNLARAGILDITLVDPDKIVVENTYRHTLGIIHRQRFKASALKKEIERLVPHVNVEPHDVSIYEYIKNNPDSLKNSDLVIAATGNHNVELWLNEMVWKESGGPAIIHTWLEPYGIGGHALLSHVPQKEGSAPGCLECIYDYSAISESIENKAAFAKNGDTYTREMMGCGGSLPFGYLDASRTAELACRQALQYLKGDIQESMILSWKGDCGEFLDEGFSTTPRFTKTEEALFEDRKSHIRPDCLICAR